jgi:hypothetical protein
LVPTQVEITGEPAVKAYCHCNSCRSWLSAPVHAAALWSSQNVKVTKGADNPGLYKRTENSDHQFCKSCGASVLVLHPDMGMAEVPAGSVNRLTYQPTVHVHHDEKVWSVHDGTPRVQGFPKVTRLIRGNGRGLRPHDAAQIRIRLAALAAVLDAHGGSPGRSSVSPKSPDSRAMK